MLELLPLAVRGIVTVMVMFEFSIVRGMSGCGICSSMVLSNWAML